MLRRKRQNPQFVRIHVDKGSNRAVVNMVIVFGWKSGCLVLTTNPTTISPQALYVHNDMRKLTNISST